MKGINTEYCYLGNYKREGYSMLKDLVMKNRTHRRFYENIVVSRESLKELIDLVRIVPSTANLQALKFILFYTKEDREKVFPYLSWAGALPDWNGPEAGERPAAYIMILCDKQLGEGQGVDDGIAAQTIMLGATEKGLGGCILGNIKREELIQKLELDGERYSIELVLALGKPKEKVMLTDVKEDGDIRYYRDENQMHYVPKRKLEDLIIEL